MGNINTIVLSGRVANPELKVSANGNAVFKFRLATNIWQGEGQEDKTMWTDVVFFKKAAEALGKLVTKGMSVTVQGTLDYNEWEDKKNGIKRSSHQIKGTALQLPPKQKQEEEPEYAYNDIDF